MQLTQKRTDPAIKALKEDTFLGSVPIIFLRAKRDEESKLIGTEVVLKRAWWPQPAMEKREHT